MPLIVNKQKGFTLVEVLVAVFILAIGLMGLASLQVMSVKTNQSAYYRSQASILAYDILDRMRANRNAFLTGAYDNVDTDNDPESDQGCYDNDGCSADQLADQDVREWTGYFRDVANAGANFVPLIPGGKGTIAREGGDATVTVIWEQDEWQGGDKVTAERQVQIVVRI